MNLIKKILYTGILLAGSAVAALLSSGCSSTQSSSIDKIVLDSLNPRNVVTMQEKEPNKTGKQYLNGGLDKVIGFEMSYQKASKHKLTYSEINFFTIGDNEENKEIVDVLNSIDTSTYGEFIANLSGLTEDQIICTLSALADLAVDTIYTGRNDNHSSKKLNAESVYYLIKEFSFKGMPSNEKKVFCKHILNFVSETAKRAGLPEAVTVSCNTRKERHVIPAVWLPDGSIRLIDYGNIYAGNSDLELVLRGYQKVQKRPAFAHRVHKDEDYLFTLTTFDGEIFYNAIDHSKDTKQLKEVLTNQNIKKTPLEIRVGNTENSFRVIDENNMFCKTGLIKGPEDNFWFSSFFQIGFEDYRKGNNLKYNINFLTVPLKNHTISGISGNVIYEKKIISDDSNNLTIAGQLTSLLDLAALETKFTPITEDRWLTLTGGICHTHTLDKKTKVDIYTLIMAEPTYSNVLTNEIKPVISEARTGYKLTLENAFINLEYLYERQADTLSLGTGWLYRLSQDEKLSFGFALSTSESRFKYIWPDEKCLKFSSSYLTDSFSIGSSIKYSQKKWYSDERYDFGIKFWISCKF